MGTSDGHWPSDQAETMRSAGARQHAQLEAELRATAQRLAVIQARLAELSQMTKMQLRQRSADRVIGRSDDGLASVVCAGDGVIVSIELEQTRYRRVTTAHITRAVVNALERARKAAGIGEQRRLREVLDDGGRSSEAIEELHARLMAADQRLAEQMVEGCSPDGVVTATYGGAGSLHDLRISSEALVKYTFPELGRLIVAALQAAEHNSDRLRQMTYDAIEIGGETLGNMRRYPVDASEIVRRAFGATGPRSGGGGTE